MLACMILKEDLMAVLPEAISKAWEDREGPAVFTTVDDKGIPNSIYVMCVGIYDGSTIVIADNYFDKTRKNIFAGSYGSILFITKDNEAYQVKGPITYHMEGDIFAEMKKWNPEKHPGHAAAALTVEEVYSGSKKLV